MLLRVENLTKRFGGLLAVNRVSFNVETGTISGIIGPNGAGKTTLLNCIAGAYKPEEGSVYFSDEKISGKAAEVVCEKGISRTFQIPQPFPKLSVLENVLVSALFSRRLEPKTDPLEHARRLIDLVEFPLPLDTLANSLNTAHLKRLDLARALASNPKLLLLDEPAAGLTPVELESLMKLIQKINSGGTTIILIEHLMRFVIGLCESLVVLHFGQLIGEGPTLEVAQDPNVIDAYLGKEYYL